MRTKLTILFVLCAVLVIGSSAQAVLITHSAAGTLIPTYDFESDSPGSNPGSPWTVVEGASGVVGVGNSTPIPGAYEGANYLSVSRGTASASAFANFPSQAKAAGSFTLTFAMYRKANAAVGINWAPTGSSSVAGKVFIFGDGTVNRYYGGWVDMGIDSLADTWQEWTIWFDPSAGTPKVSVTIDGSSVGPADVQSTFGSYDRVEFGAGGDNSQFFIDAFPLRGDVNGDGFTGGRDLNIILTNWGMTGGASFADGDLTADGNVNVDDYTYIKPYLGTGTPPEPAEAPAEPPATIPEPNTLLVLSGAVVAGLVRRR